MILNKENPKIGNAILSTVAVAFSFFYIYQHYGTFTQNDILLVIAAQSIGGIYFGNANALRLKVSLQFSMLLMFSFLLGCLATINILFAILGIFITALCTNYWFRFFPINAGDLIIPSGLIFFMTAYNGTFKWFSDFYVLQGCIIGILCQFVVFLIQGKKRNKPQSTKVNEQIEKIHWDFSMNKTEITFTLNLFLLLICGYFAAKYLKLPHGYWIPFTTIVLLRSSIDVTKKRIFQRNLGTIAGVVITFGIMHLHLSKEILLLIILIANFLCVINLKKNYTWSVLFITLFVMIQTEYTSSLPMAMALERFEYTLATGILVFIVIWINTLLGSSTVKK